MSTSGRTRNRGSRSPNTVTWILQSHQKRLWYGSPQFQTLETVYAYNGYVDDRQEMIDCIGARGRFNECHHTRRLSTPVSGPTAVSAGLTPPTNWPYGPDWTTYARSLTAPTIGCSIQGLLPNDGDWIASPGFPGIDWTELVDQVGQQLDGHMVTGQNLLVSLMQITQTVGMFKNPFGVRKLGNTLDSLSLSKIAKSGASTYLEYKFGWENIYRDIVAIAKVWNEVRQHQNYLETTVRKYVSASSRQSDTVTGSSNGLRTLYAYGDTILKFKLSRAVRTACFSLDIRRTEQALHWSKVDQVCSRLGARSLAEALWDLVPYSFVVDWFTHVNRFIRQRPVDFNTFDLRRIGYSVKTDWYVSSEWTQHADGYQQSVKSSGNGGEMHAQREYHRYPGIPSGCGSVGLFGNLNKTQIAEGLALIVQRI